MKQIFNIQLILTGIIFGLLLFPLASSAATNEGIAIKWLDVKTSYKANETIKIGFELINNSGGVLLNSQIESGYRSLVVPTPPLEFKKVNLANGKKYSDVINLGKVEELFEPGRIDFFVRVRSFDGKLLAEFEKPSEIKTLPSIALNYELGNKKVYKVGEVINFNLKAPKLKSAIKQKIVIEKSGKIVFSSTTNHFKWTVKQTGDYLIKINAEAKGYRPYSRVINITVITNGVKVQSVKELIQKQASLNSATPQRPGPKNGALTTEQLNQLVNPK